ncbi:hypothetical protein CDAR_388741 [Caerostris darwini]|uniref:Uncharacterized protein n=1 Tax=Caerostris darwini TaxID=1538125 RepID=A0AAV4RI86_9ARAC|nr:hypothetical protein CDAR_555911 [Caerostris darwini]GIY44269.1 hypothetical protein CDAR_388741 [Caerostris darwini]
MIVYDGVKQKITLWSAESLFILSQLNHLFANLQETDFSVIIMSIYGVAQSQAACFCNPVTKIASHVFQMLLRIDLIILKVIPVSKRCSTGKEFRGWIMLLERKTSNCELWR